MKRVHLMPVLVSLCLAPAAALAQEKESAHPEGEEEGEEEVGYGRAGVIELGGSAGFTAAADFTSANLTPSLGWFLVDNVQISGLLGVSYIESHHRDATMFSLLIEPSYYLPFGETTFGFMGFGIGGSHVEHAGYGLSFAPRVGAKIRVGRSGLLSPSLSYLYTTHDTDGMSGDTLMAVSAALSANIGYTIIW